MYDKGQGGPTTSRRDINKVRVFEFGLFELGTSFRIIAICMGNIIVEGLELKVVKLPSMFQRPYIKASKGSSWVKSLYIKLYAKKQ